MLDRSLEHRLDSRLERRSKLAAVCLALAFLTLSLAAPLAATDPPPLDLGLAMNDPDQLAWQLFAYANRPADNGTNEAAWETWAEESVVYEDPCTRPEWPGKNPGPFPARPSKLVDALKSRGLTADDFNIVTGDCNLQQVKLNRPFFEYVVDHHLWFQEGVIRAASTEGIDFPVEAIVYKADWAEISEEEKPLYHWRLVSRKEYEAAFGAGSSCTQSSGISDAESEAEPPVVLGLVAFHIVSKAIDNWVWTTWNHAMTPGRCDYIGCRDDFGSDPSYFPPHLEMGRPYDPGKLTPEVQRLMRSAGLGEAWRHYRLMGTQNTFTDSTGRPTVLGNVVLEPGFGNTSSCQTCHARATLSATGSSLAILESIDPMEGNVGTPDPSWYYVDSAVPATPIVYQTDFMWQLTEVSSRDDCSSDDQAAGATSR